MTLIGLLLLPVVALLLLAAHFVHAGAWPAAALVTALLVLLGVRRAWAARTLQVVLALGSIEWLLTAVLLARLRAQHDQPYLRLLAILGAVAVVTTLAAFVFQHPRLRSRFGLDR